MSKSMRKKGMSPKEIIVIAIIGVISLIIALICKTQWFAGNRWEMLFFWLVYLALASSATFLAGRFMKRRRK